MNWFDTSGLTNLAKSALKEAQKTIDKALDIQDDSGEEQEGEPTGESKSNSPAGTNDSTQKDNTDFFASWGLTVSAESVKDEPIKEQPVVTESPSKSSSQSMWGSFAGSFFEQPNAADGTIVRPPKAKSMNIISDAKFDSQDDLFSKSQLVMSENDGSEYRNVKTNSPKPVERRGSSRSNILSLVSSRNSSDSVEVLSQSMKTTPDSEVSAQSMSHSSSVGLKLNSESVEILPDSLVSPSSIECLGFDSCSSERNSGSSSILSPDISDKKSTPVGDRTERAETADSVSLVADDDEDTMSYNSVSECTAPTVLDTEDKSVSPFPKAIRTEPRKMIDKEFIHLEPALLPQKMQLSENSSNDGSWSDRTLNADNDSVILDAAIEEKKETEHEDAMMEKLSDSSSFYNVNVSSEMLRSASSAFVNVEKRQCGATESSNSSQKDGSVKERISPVSSESKSDLVKIGSDRTSGHTSGDELETTTSSDIEIIPSPNGDNGHGFCRNSPAKYAFKGKFDGTTSPNLVDLVLGKSLATKIRGHNRELSEVSIQSNTSDESQGSENDRLMRRLCEMTEILEARENRLMEVSRNNAELTENNADLKSQVESLLAKQEMADIHSITEDYTERLSALEKKFQQAIREKDGLRKQLDTMKADSSRKNSTALENMLREKDDIIAQLQEEGEKLAGQQLHHTNIIKKLRFKEKDNEQVIKDLRDKIAELTSELDRVKRAVAAKEELEVNQIEAVYRLTTANKKMETELIETRSALDDTTQRLESTRTNLEVVRKELSDLQRSSAESQLKRGLVAQLQADKAAAEAEVERLRREVQQLRTEFVEEEKRWVSRTESLRTELSSAREAGAADAALAAEGPAPAALLHQLAALQRAALHRQQAHEAHARHLADNMEELENSLAKSVERERLTREESSQLHSRLAALEALLHETQQRLDTVTQQCQQWLHRNQALEEQHASKTAELERLKETSETEISELQARVSETEKQLAAEREALETEKKRSVIMQEASSTRGDISPSHSLASDTFSTSFWPPTAEEYLPAGVSLGAGAGALCVESLVAGLQRREGELRHAAAARDSLAHQRDTLRAQLAAAHADLDECRTVQEQYDALLQMYGEKEEQLEEVRLDLQDVTQLYKAQLDELIALKQQAGR